MLKRRKKDSVSEVMNDMDNETGTERRECESSEEQAAALRGLMSWFGWLAFVVSTILGVTIFCLVWNDKTQDGLVWIVLVGLFFSSAISGLCWQRRRDLRRQIN